MAASSLVNLREKLATLRREFVKRSTGFEPLPCWLFHLEGDESSAGVLELQGLADKLVLRYRCLWSLPDVSKLTRRELWFGNDPAALGILETLSARATACIRSPGLPSAIRDRLAPETLAQRGSAGWAFAMFELSGETHWAWSSGSGTLWPAVQNLRPRDTDSFCQHVDHVFLSAADAIGVVLGAIDGECGSPEPVEYFVTLLQAAAIVSRSKKTLERLKLSGNFPMPRVQGGGGKPDEWAWSEIRPYLEKHFNHPLPERFPTDRLH